MRLTRSSPIGSTCYDTQVVFPVIINTYSTDNEGIDIHDLTDGAGHGLLVATDNIWLSHALTVNCPGIAFQTGSGQVTCEIIYRMKKITLAEYVGIVQSQQ